MTGIRDRAIGALAGLALGDALGMPTQSMSRRRIAERYGPITGLLDVHNGKITHPAVASSLNLPYVHPEEAIG